MAKSSLSSQMKKLKTQAEENTTISRGNNRDGYKTVKQGAPLDHEAKQSTSKSKNPFTGQTFGMSKGITKNMDNYESLRIDCWLSDVIQEGETVQQAFTRVEAVIDEVLEESVINTVEEY